MSGIGNHFPSTACILGLEQGSNTVDSEETKDDRVGCCCCRLAQAKAPASCAAAPNLRKAAARVCRMPEASIG